MPQRVRIVTYAWGDRYIGDLLNATVPALLAPGNLPALTEAFDCDVVLLSQAHKFDTIRAHPAFVRLAATCPTRLASLDDLIVGPWYGISLTFALHRGIADLGPAMVDTFCIFLNADFILADGALRSLGTRIAADERLIVAPGYCAITEAVAPILRQRRDDTRMELVIPPRELAALALRHRHYTMRAKTVNQQVFRTEHYDQFYWYVDDDTMLARHLPIAVICMRPQRHIEEMRTYWDYGLVSDACPDVVPCVLGDSDDFMMLELRDEKTYTDLVSLGWPSLQEIADDLSSFTTKDHRDYGRYTLVLHAAPLPPALAAEQRKFDAYMDQLYARLRPTPVSHRDHPYWSNAIDAFKQRSAAYLREQAARADSIEIGVGAGPASAPAPIGARPRLREFAQHAYARTIGSLPTVTRNHPCWTDLHAAAALVRAALARPEARILIVKSQFNVFKRLVDGVRVREEPTGLTDALLASPVPGGLRDIAAFGGVRLSADMPACGAASGGSIVLTADRPMVVHLSPDSGMSRALRASALVATVGAPAGADADAGPFDLCLCDLSYEEFVDFRQIYAAIRPRMRTGGTVLALFLNRTYKSLDAKDGLLIKNAFPLTDTSRVRFQGSRGVRWLRRLFDHGVRLTGALGVSGRLAAPLVLAASFGLAAIVNRVRPAGDDLKFRQHASSIALELTVTRGAGAPP